MATRGEEPSLIGLSCMHIDFALTQTRSDCTAAVFQILKLPVKSQCRSLVPADKRILASPHSGHSEWTLWIGGRNHDF
jgi:hypothetical protein